MTAPAQIQVPAGHVVVTTFGSLRHEMVQCWMELRSLCEKNGLHNVHWATLPGTLVEKARNEAVRQLLRNPQAQWLLQIDGDMTFPPDSLLRMLQTVYQDMPHIDALGAYCPLRGEMALCTIDTGTGTWESHFPGSGIMEVMRTGAAFLLVKRRVFEALSDPWFRMRVPARPLDFMAEVDNWARMKWNGENPFRGLPNEPWEKLERCARDDPSAIAGSFVPVEVGEDSGLMDRLRNAGFRAYVNTDVVCGHVDSVVRGWPDHKKAMEQLAQNQRYASGLLA